MFFYFCTLSSLDRPLRYLLTPNFNIQNAISLTWTCDCESSWSNSFRSQLYLCPGAEIISSIASRQRATASPGGARVGDITVELILSYNCWEKKTDKNIFFHFFIFSFVLDQISELHYWIVFFFVTLSVYFGCITCKRAHSRLSVNMSLSTSSSTYSSWSAWISSSESRTRCTASRPASSSAQSFSVSDAMPIVTGRIEKAKEIVRIDALWLAINWYWKFTWIRVGAAQRIVC